MTALADLKVLDMSRVLAGPNCTQIFSDFGAEVWKIEALWGDESRGWGSSGFAMVNRGKNSLVINLAESRGQEIVRALAVRADVAVENFKVGNLARFGIDLPSLMKLNDRLIAVSITGFGQTGPYKSGLGYDIVLQAMTGLMSVTGFPDRPPARLGAPVNDIMLGLNAAIGALVALHERSRSGKGQYIDVSLFDVGMAALLADGGRFMNDGVVPTRQGGQHPTHAPCEAFEAADGPIMIAVGTDTQFERLCKAIGQTNLATDPRFARNATRYRNRAELAHLLSAVLRTRTRAAWQQEFLAHKVPAGPLYDVPDALEDPHAKARNMVWTIDGGNGPLKVLANPLQHMSRTPPRPASAPRLGANTREVLHRELAMTDAEIELLVRDGVIGVEPMD